MIIKYGDAETINVIQPADLADEDTKQKLDDLKSELAKKEPTQANQEQE
jgi:hypothetical protein